LIARLTKTPLVNAQKVHASEAMKYKQITVVFHEIALYEAIKAAAEREKRAISNYIVCLLRKRFARKLQPSK